MDWNSFLYSMISFAAMVFFLWCCNLTKKQRFRQLWCPVTAILFSITALFFYIKPYAYILQLIDSIFLYIENYIGRDLLNKPDSFPLYYNLIILMSFCLIKFITNFFTVSFLLIKRVLLYLKGIIFKRTIVTTGNPSLSFAYRYDMERGITLKNEYVFLFKVFRAASWLSFLILIVCIFLAYQKMWPTMPLKMPILPVLPLLMLFEISWYLGGLRPSPEEGSIRGEDVFSDIKGRYDSLWDEYLAKWSDRILVSGRGIKGISNKQPATFNTPASDEELTYELDMISRNMMLRGVKLDGELFTALKKLWANEDLLISCPNHEKFSPVLFASLQRDIIEGHNIIFLTNQFSGNENRKELIGWIKRWLSIPIVTNISFKIVDIDNLTNRDEINILVASIQELLVCDMKNNREWFNQVKTVCIPNISETLFSNILPASALFQILADRSTHKLQLVFMATENRRNLEPSVRQYRNSEPYEPSITQRFPHDVNYIAWRTEGEQPFQEAVFKANRRYCGTGLILAVPALKHDVDEILLLEAEKKPWVEYTESIDNALETETNRRVNEVLKNFSKPYALTPKERVFVITYDCSFNLVVTLKKALSIGRIGVFAHVVSPPYLLRDYFADNMDFFLNSHSEAPVSLAPVPVLEPSFVAYCLKERLFREQISEDEVNNLLNRVKCKTPSSGNEKDITYHVEGALSDFMNEGYDIDIQPYLDLIQYDEFGMDVKQFKKINRLKLNRPNQPLFPEDIDPFIIRGPGGNLLGKIDKDLLYQNYLPGQIHSFNGKAFRIDTIDSDQKVITAKSVAVEDSRCYRNIKTINILSVSHHSQRQVKEFDGICLTRTLYEAFYEIKTCGYFSFLYGIQFTKGASYLPLDHIPVRVYPKGRMLHLCITLDGLILSSNARSLSYSIALLLNEIFPTVFPETFQYLLATSHPPGSSDGDEKIKKFVPELSLDEEIKHESSRDILKEIKKIDSSEDTISVFIIEDSTVDKGMVNSLFDNLNYLFSIIEDYLSWLLQKKDNGNTFLCYGKEKLPEWLKIEDALEISKIIADQLPHSLRKSRESFYTRPDSGDISASADNRLCDFCGEPISSTSYEQLTDGRERCKNCKETSVDTIELLNKVYKDSRSWLVNSFKLKLRKNITVRFENTRTIQEITGRRFVPTSGYDARTIGVAIKEGDNYCICIENGQPSHLTIATIVHELTHIWQYDNLDFVKMKKEYGLLLTEGHAVWVEICCLQSKKIGLRHCEKQAGRSDEYGEGFRLVDSHVKKSGGIHPFTILKNLYPA